MNITIFIGIVTLQGILLCFMKRSMRTANVSFFYLLFYTLYNVYFHDFDLFLSNKLRRVAQSVGVYTECQKLLSISYYCRDWGKFVSAAFAKASVYNFAVAHLYIYSIGIMVLSFLGGDLCIVSQQRFFLAIFFSPVWEGQYSVLFYFAYL